MGDTNQTSIAVVAESTFGVTPTNGMTFTRFTGESLAFNIDNTQSNEIRADRNVQDIIRTNASVAGDLNFELSYGTYDTLLEGLMMSTYSSNVLKNGSTLKSFSLEKKFELGSTDKFHLFKGCRIGSMGLNISAGEIVTGNFTVLGKNMTVSTSAVDSSIDATTTAQPFNAVNNVTQILEGGSGISESVMSLSLTIDNNLRAQNEIGNLGATGIGLGQFSVTGSMSAYFSSGTLYEKFVNGTDSALSITLNDGSNSYTFLLPKIEYTTGTVTAGSTNSDVMSDLEFIAKYDTSEACTLKITRA